jgi:hypothetical protein
MGGRRSLGQFVLNGAAGGLLAGIVFALIEMVVSALIGYSALTPFRAIGSIVLGPSALSAGFPEATAVATGGLLHLVLSAFYGAIFAAILWVTDQVGRLTSISIAIGVVYALALWAINFLVIAPVLFDQLLVESAFWLSFTLAHASYGLVLGTYMLATDPKREEQIEPETR